MDNPNRSAPLNLEDYRAPFRLLAVDTSSDARRAELVTRRGTIDLPAFMPVGTQATVKSLTPADVRATGSQILLANTYHLMLRPGLDIIEAAGGLHQFMGWSGPILTDSGGFQVFSLANRRKVSEQGVTFRSHLDGSAHELTPERAIDLQLGFGSDVVMMLDDVVGFESDDARQLDSMERTHRWLDRAVRHWHNRADATVDNHGRALLFGISQGGFDGGRRCESASIVAESAVDGCAIGGLSVGEPKETMAEMLAASISALPVDRPRYLMGVGSPEDLWHCVALGVDMFDCVHPTRVARRGALFTLDGRVNITSARFARDFDPVDPTCDCETCTTFSAAYLHHLFRAHELLAYRLGTIHNLRFMQRQMAAIRQSIEAGSFGSAKHDFLARYQVSNADIARKQRERWNAARTRTGGL
ncbi:MAG TPA: tRNA guanosine(34) transglycosylase Tgt [Nitrolancea sp.]